VHSLIKERQCYVHVFDLDTVNFSVDAETRVVSLLTPAANYTYEEKKLLNETNIGSFGFGVNIPIGSNFSKSTATNYNYMQDP